MYTHYRERPSFEEIIKKFNKINIVTINIQWDIIKRLKEQVETHETKGTSLQIRRNIIKAQPLANYQNEYDKIRSILDQSITKRTRYQSDASYERKKKKILGKLGANEEMFQKRKEHLEKLGAYAIDSISDLK